MNVLIVHREEGRAATPLKIELAGTVWRRFCGLLGRKELPASSALWLRPCNSVHCFFMRFAIDVIYLDASGNILRIQPQLKPWRFSLCRAATSVIELAAGECQRLDIKPGDQLQCVI